MAASDPSDPAAHGPGDRMAARPHPAPGVPGPVPGQLPLRRPEWVAHVLDGDRAVLLHLPSGRRVVLSPEATAIWQEVVRGGAAGATADDVTAALAPQYAVETEVIGHDVAVLLGALLDEQLVEPVGAAAVGPEDAADGEAGRG